MADELDRYPCPMLRCGWYLSAHELAHGDPRAGTPRASIAEYIAQHLLVVHAGREAQR